MIWLSIWETHLLILTLACLHSLGFIRPHASRFACLSAFGIVADNRRNLVAAVAVLGRIDNVKCCRHIFHRQG